MILSMRRLDDVVTVSAPIDNIALLVCDVYDSHWCKSTNERYERTRKRIAEFVDIFHDMGGVVIHSPNNCVDTFYANYPQRKKMRLGSMPRFRKITEGKQPIPTDGINGCDDVPSCYNPSVSEGKQQYPGINIAENDCITARALELIDYIDSNNIYYVLYSGFALNLCMLNNEIGIRRMMHWGVNCLFFRDLTDVFYSPKQPPHVSVEKALDLMVKYVENYWCASVSAHEILF